MALKKTTALKIVKKVKKAYGVPIVIGVEMETAGAGAQANLVEGQVELPSLEGWSTPAQLMSSLIHEVAHILCGRLGIYSEFHSTKHHSELTEKELRTFLATAWKAECYVERMAKDMMAELFPGELFHFCYGRLKVEKEWFDREYLGDYRRELRKRVLRRIDRERKRG